MAGGNNGDWIGKEPGVAHRHLWKPVSGCMIWACRGGGRVRIWPACKWTTITAQKALAVSIERGALKSSTEFLTGLSKFSGLSSSGIKVVHKRYGCSSLL